MKVRPLFKKKWKMPVWVSALIICVFIGLTFWVVALLTREEYISSHFEQFQTELDLFYLNLLPIIWVIGIIYAISRRALFSGLSGMSIFTIMAGINLLKSGLREDPFVPQDVRLLKEAFSLVNNYLYGGTALIITALILLLAILALIFLKFEPDRIHWFVSLGLSLIIIVAAGASVTNIYADKELYNSFSYVYGGKASEYGCKGFVYSFIHDIAIMNIEKPDGNDPNLFKRLEQEGNDPADYEDAVKPHIIAIMGEAFSTVSEEDAFDFTDYTDPLANFKKIAAESVLKGNLAVDSYGGGTVFTEFAFLTGVSPSILNTVSPYDYVRQDMDSLPRQLAGIGYDNLAVHPGYGWFYNRDNVYKYFDFSEFYNRDNSFDPESQSRGGYISEEATMDKVIERFQNHLDTSDSPLLEFCVTIQNHGPYYDKYGADAGPNFDSNIDYSDEDINILTNYFFGLREADEQLDRLVEYLKSVDEPVVLLYFGDHLPSLSTTIYQPLGYSFDDDIESFMRLYTTPYIIWQNSAAESLGVIEKNLKGTELNNGAQISSYYLGTTLMELLGFDGLSPFYSYVNELRPGVPVMTLWRKYRDASGIAMTEVPPGAEDMVAKYLGWGYFKLFQQEVS